MAKRRYRYPCDTKILEAARALARQAARDDYATMMKEWEEAKAAESEEAKQTWLRKWAARAQ